MRCATAILKFPTALPYTEFPTRGCQRHAQTTHFCWELARELSLSLSGTIHRNLGGWRSTIRACAAWGIEWMRGSPAVLALTCGADASAPLRPPPQLAAKRDQGGGRRACICCGRVSRRCCCQHQRPCKALVVKAGVTVHEHRNMRNVYRRCNSPCCLVSLALLTAVRFPTGLYQR